MVASAGRTELATELSGRRSAITLALVLALVLLASPAAARAAEWTVTSTADTVDGNLGDGVCATASGACTLRAAIQEANMRNGADAITVPGGVYTIRGTAAEPGTPGGGLGFDPALFVDWEGDYDIAGPLTITGAGMGATIVDGGTPPFGAPPDQTAIDRLFEIHPTAGDVTISGLTAREGWSADEGGGIVNRSTGVVRLVDVAVRDSVSTAYGGGIYNVGPLDGICPLTCPLGNGRLELTRVEVTGNSTGGEGGGVFSTESTLRVSGRTDARSLFRGNTAGEGAAIFHGGEATPTGARARLEIGHARFADNVASASGGAVYNGHEGDLVVADSEFADNLAWDAGGAIESGGKTSASITRSTFAGNRAGGSGGAVASHGERPATISASTFTGNHAGVDLIDELGQFHEGEGGAGALELDGTGSATVLDSRFEHNTASGEGGALVVASFGSVLVADSAFRHNEAEISGGAILNAGNRVTFRRLVINENEAHEAGGGIDNQGSGEFTVDQTTIARNEALDGGGFQNRPDSLSRVINSTFFDNRARNTGGGFYHESDAETEIENTTISGNNALVAGGGVYVDADAGLRVIHTTVTQNRAPAGSGVGKPIESVNFPIEPSMGAIFRNSIVAGNLGSPDCNGAWGSEGGNIDGGTDCHFRGTRDRVATPPRLDALADNGGPTMTHAPRPDSFAIDGAVSPAIQLVDGATAVCPDHDQRGVTRPRNGRCDIGAHEFEGPFPPPDDVEPETEIDPNAPVQTGEIARFRFSGTDDVTAPEELTFECRVLVHDPTDPPEPVDPTEPVDPLDPELMWHGCASPWPGDALQLEEGPSRLEVRAIDRAGNVDPTPDVHLFMAGQDIVPPQTILTGTPPATTSRTSAVFGFTATDDSTDITLIEYECRIDGGDWEAVECLNPMGFSNLTIGTHTFQVRAIDEGDNIDPTPATYTWTITAPVSCDGANITLGANADTWVDETDQLENFGIAEVLSVRSAAFGDNARALVRFTLPAGMPSECTLQSARLRLHSDGEPGRVLDARRIAGAWVENQVNWVNQPGTTGDPASAESGAGYREWDVTAHVEAMLGGAANHGWLIRDRTEGDPEGAEQGFSSKDTLADPPEVPQLRLRFTGGTPTPVPPPPAEDLEPTQIECGMAVTESIRALNDISCELGDGLVVAAPDVIVDLDGHTIDGPDYLLLGQEENLPAGIRVIGHDNVVVRNGTVREFGNGVAVMGGARFGVVHHMTLERNALAGVELWDADDGRHGNTIRDNDFAGNGNGVVALSGTEHNVIRDNVFTGELGMAVHLIDASLNRIEGNDVSGVPIDPNLDSDGGFLLEGATDNVIVGNRLVETGDAGMLVVAGSHRTRVEGNVMSRTGDAGVAVEDSEGSEIIDNVAHLGSDAGVVIGNADDSTVIGNDVRFNPGGVAASEASDSVIRANDADGTTGTGIEVSGSLRTLIADNRASGTRGTGIVVEGDALDLDGDPLDGNVLRGNTTHGNLGDGIAAAAGHELADNAASNNAGWGIDGAEATPDAAGVIDGGGNTASGNAEPEQCRGVVCAPGDPVPPVDTTDLMAPDTQITEQPADGVTGALPQVFRFTGTDNVAPDTALRFECRIDPPPDPTIPPEPPEPPEPGEPPEPLDPPVTEHWEECASPVRFAYMFAGEHRFEVRAIDPSDNVDPTPAVYVWDVSAAPPGPDDIAPVTTITEAPADPTHERSATFRFRASDNSTPGPDLRYECRLDGGAWATCESPVTYTGMALGDHVFAVRARDAQLNWDATPATHAWTVVNAPPDTNMPETTLDATPDPQTIQTGATFTFSSDEAGSTFECRLDGGAWAACASPHTLSGLARTAHTFEVRAVDPAGNADPTPASFAWTIGPAAVLRTVSCGQTLTTSTRLANDLAECQGDGLVAGAPNITIDLDGHTIDGTGLAAGIRVNGHDRVTITGGGRLTEFDHGIAFGSGTRGGIVSGVTVELNQEAGVHFSNADEAGEGNLIRDTLVTNNSLSGIAITGGTDAARIIGNTIGGNPAAGVRVGGASGTRVEGNTITSSGDAGVLLEGANGTVVVENDISGNSGEPVAITLASQGNRVVRNELAGNAKGVVVEQSNANQIVDNAVTETGDTAIGLAWANDNELRGNDVSGNSGGIELYQSSRNLVVENDASDNSGAGIAVADLSLSNVLRRNTANANDADGIAIEAEAPPGSGTLLDRNVTNENSSDGITVNKVGHTLVGNTANNNGSWGMYATVPTVLGANVDGGGNRATGNTQLEQCFQIRCDGGAPATETLPPETTITDGPPDATPFDDATFRFTGTDNSLLPLEFQCRLDGGAWQACASPHSVDGLADGAHVFEVRAVDPAGNVDPTPARAEWTRAPLPSGIPPETTIDSAPDRVTTATSATFAFSSNEPGARFECRLDGGAWALCEPPRTYSGLAQGAHEFAARAIDAEDLVDGSPATFAWTVGPPPQPAAVACGQVVTQSILLTNSLADCPGDGLVVGAPGITIDLDGNTIDGIGLGTGVRNPSHDGVTVTNGLVQEFARGVAIEPSADNVVSGITAQLNGTAGIELAGADDAVVRESTLTANEGAGVLVGGGASRAVVRDATITANAAEGVLAQDANALRVEGTSISGSGASGIVLESALDAVVARNVLAANGGGIDAQLQSHRVQVSDNAIATGDEGIRIVETNAARVVDNVVQQTTGTGITIEAADAAVVRRNDVRFNGAGIALADATGAQVESNDASGTSGTGISAEGNAIGNVIARNTATGNGSEGIAVSDAAPTGQGNLIDRNAANANGSDGILVAGTGHTVVANSAYMNAGWGMYAEPGNTDGGGNLAAGNEEPAQCFNIVCDPGGFVVPGLPDTTILEHPEDPSNSRNASFTFIGSDDTTPLADLGFQCRLDSSAEADWADCENPQEYTGLSAGQHVFEVRAVDLSENADPTPAQFSWEYQPLPSGVAPDTEIDLAPAASTPLLDAVFTFSSNEPDVTYECQLDAGPWEECAVFYEAEFEDYQVGPHTFRVRAIDFEGNVDPTPAMHEWTITGLVTVILDGPAYEPGPDGEPATGGETESTTATFDFVANASEVAYECSLDLGAWVPCDSPVTYTGMAVGDHLFRVIATDLDGQQVQIEPTEYEWTVIPTVDTAAPVMALLAAPATGTSEVAFSFTATDDQTSLGQVAFECRLDSSDPAAWYDCTGEGPVGGQVSHNVLTEFPELTPGSHTLEIRATDEAGNISEPVVHTWTATADVTAPETTLLDTPDAETLALDAVFAFAATDNATPVEALVTECALDGAAFAPCSSPHEISVEPGAHVLEVRAVDLAGNADATPARFEWTVIGPPVTTFTTTPADPSATTAAAFTFAADQSGATYACSLNGSPMVACESPIAFDVGGGGEYTLAVQATNPQGLLEEQPAEFTWTVNAPADTTAPDTTVLTGPADGTTSTTATFTFASSQFGSTFECSLDGGSFAACVSPHEVLELAGGEHALEVRATDPSGNADPTPATWEWTLDGPPVTTILSAPPEEAESTTAEFQFISSDAGSTFECFLDGVTVPCTSPHVYTGLAVGDHVFAVRATDPAGQVEAIWVEHEWTVVPIQAPQTTLTDGPPAETVARTASFAFAADEAGSTFACSLDGAPFTACDVPAEVAGLGVGEHAFEVRATDVFGNADATPARYEWTVVGIADVQTAIVSGPAPTLPVDTQVQIAFTASVDGVAFECSLDGGPFTACTSPADLGAPAAGEHAFEVRAVDGAGGAEPGPARREFTVVGAPVTTIDAAVSGGDVTFGFSADQGDVSFACALDGGEPAPCEPPVSYTDVGGGTHAFTVVATNGFGLEGEPATFEWTVAGGPETTPPQTAITGGPPAETAATDATFAFAGTDNMTGAAELGFECSLDGGPFAACTTPYELTDVAEGDHTLAVRAVDAAGNADPTPAGRAWRVLDTTPPETAIDSGPDNPTTATGGTFTFSSDEAGSTFECSLDGGAFASCTSPRVVSGLALGDHRFRVRATDAAGNADPTPAVHEWVVEEPPDTTAPVTGIASGPPATTAATTATFAFTADEAVDGFECALDGGAFAACDSPHVVEGLALGDHTLDVRATDLAGNTDQSPARHTWRVVDGAPPETTIGAGAPPESTTSTTAAFGFTADEAGATFECQLDTGAWGACTSPKAYTSLSTAQHTFRVRATDAAGNTDPTPATHTWTITPTCTGSTVTVGAAADSWLLQSSAGQNYGADSTLKVAAKSGGNSRALVRFTLPAIPAGCQVTQARLRMFASSSKTGRTLQALRASASWTEGGVNWSNQPSTTGTAATVASGSGYREWTVTSHVQSMYSTTNHGFLIRDATEGGGGIEQGFNSREKGSDNPPRLVVTFG